MLNRIVSRKIEIYFTFLFSIIFCFCSNLTPKEKGLMDSLTKHLKTETFKTVYIDDKIMCYEKFRNKYKFYSVQFLKNSCAPCYPKFIEWQQRMKTFNAPKSYSVLFVIQGNSYEQFMHEVNTYAKTELGMDTVTNSYPVVMDPDFTYLSANSDIPRWIIESSVLIDSKNRIRMVGAPWATEDMTKLFHRICKE